MGKSGSNGESDAGLRWVDTVSGIVNVDEGDVTACHRDIDRADSMLSAVGEQVENEAYSADSVGELACGNGGWGVDVHIWMNGHADGNGIGKDGAQRRRFVVGDAVDDAAEVVCSHSGCGEVACDIGGVVAVAVMAVGCEVESADHGVQWCAKVMEQSGCGGCDATVCGCGRLRRGLHRSECYRRQQERLCKKLL